MTTGLDLDRDVRIWAGDHRPAEQRVSIVGHHQDCFQVGPQHRPARGEGVCGGTGGRRHQHSVAAERRNRAAIDFDCYTKDTESRALFQAGFVERPTLVEDFAALTHDDIEGQPVFHPVVLRDNVFKHRIDVLGLGFGKKTDPAQVHPQHRNADVARQLGRPQEGAVAWLDAFSIPAGSKNIEGAQAFINYMIDPKFYVEWVTKVGAPVSANTKAVEALPEDAFNRKVMGDPEVAKRIQFQAPITDAQREAYLALWQQLKVDVK